VVAVSLKKTGTLYAPGDFVLNDIEISPARELFVADRTPTRPGIRIYETIANTEITSVPLDVDLPPFDISFSVVTQTGIKADVPGAATLGHNYPNPFNPETTIPFSLDRAARTTLSIYNATGQRVRVLVDDHRPAGPYEIAWDGRDEMARPVSSGVYFVKLQAGDFSVSRKLVLLK
jgi:hypothetical protein